MASDDNRKAPVKRSSGSEVEAFLKKASAIQPHTPTAGRGRLLFAMDATASREPTWDRASQIQGEMFNATRDLGGLDVQLAFYRGFGEFKVSPWLDNSARLLHMMTSVTCLAGETQIAKVLKHAANESRKKRINALVFVGDCIEEDVDKLGKLAGELGLIGVPCFMFQEGFDTVAEYSFGQIAKLSGGATCKFDATSAETLKQLLGAVAVFAAGGRKALLEHGQRVGGEVLQIAHQVKGSRP